MPGERDMTLDEVAELRRMTPRQLREFVRRRNVPVLTTGKLITFDGLALAALEEALRRCPSESDAEKTPAPSKSAAPSNYRTARGGAYENALNLTSSGSRGKKRRPSRQRSSATPGTASVVALDPLRKRSSVI